MGPSPAIIMDEDRYQELFAKRSMEIKPGLVRMQTALAALKLNPQSFLPSILIAGTNGKGSTAAYLWQLLHVSGVKAGLYTSPHLRHFRERFFLGSEAVTDQDITLTWYKIRDKLPNEVYQQLSFFELSTLIAFDLFRTHDLQVQILEVGIGGRFDATNVVEPILSMVTSIGLDHEQYLGHTLDDIAFEKIGIGRANQILFMGSSYHFDLAKAPRCQSFLSAKQIPIYSWNQQFGIVEDRIFLNFNHLPKAEFLIPADFKNKPAYLQRNFCLALAGFYQLVVHQPALISHSSSEEKNAFISNTLASFNLTPPPLPPTLLGRFQRKHYRIPGRSDGLNFRLDVCHNIDGVQALTKAIDATYPADQHPQIALISILGDKNIDLMLDELCLTFKEIILFQIPHQRTFNKEQLAVRFQRLPFFGSFAQALDCALVKTATNTELEAARDFVICGSVLAVGWVMEYLESRIENS